MADPKLANFNRYKDKVKVPKGSVLKFKAGQGYYTAPGKKPKTVVAKKKPKGLSSSEQIIKDARIRAQSTLSAAKGPIRTAGAQMGAQQVGAANGLALELGGVSQRIQDIYGTASKAQAALGQGYSDQLRATLGEGDNAMASQLGELGLPSPDGSPASGAAADVVYGLGGSMPAATLGQQGAGFASAAAFLPATTRMQGLIQKATTDRDTQQKLAELAAQYPDIFEKYLTDERNWKNQQFDNYTNYLNSQGSGGGSSARARTYVDGAGTTYVIDPATGQYIPTGSVAKTTPDNTPAAKAAAKAKTTKQAAQAKAKLKRDDDTTKQIQKVTAWLDKALKPTQIGTSGGIKIYGKSKTTYRVAFNYMFNQLWLSLKRYGYTKAHVREMASTILEARNVHPELKGPPNPNAPADTPVGGGR